MSSKFWNFILYPEVGRLNWAAGVIRLKVPIRLLEEIVGLLSVIDSVNWTDAMIHTQHELPPLSGERNKTVTFNRIAPAVQYGIAVKKCFLKIQNRQ